MTINNEIVEYASYGIIKFGSASSDVLYQNSLTDAASITADGWTTKTNTLIDNNGVSLTAATNGGLTITNLFTVAEMHNLLFNGQVSITVPTQYISESDSTTNGSAGVERGALGSIEYFVGWDDAASVYGGFSVGTNNTMLGYVTQYSSPQGAAYITTADKGSECVLTLSWSNGIETLYVDGKPLRTLAVGPGYHKKTEVATVFQNIRVGSRFGSGQWLTLGSVKNLIFSSRPVEYPVPFSLARGITFFGHSFAANGYLKTNERVYNCDSTAIQNIEREFIKKGIIPGSMSTVSLGGGYVSDLGATKLSLETANAQATEPDWFVCIMGTNDCLNIGLITDFETELDLRISEIMTSDSNMVLHTIPTLSTHVTYDTAGNVAEVLSKNASILGAPARWEIAKSAGQGSIYIADSFASFGGENPKSEYFLGQLAGALYANIHPSSKGYDQLAVDAAKVILKNIS